MNRRGFLGTVGGALAGVAGCTGRPPSGRGSASPTRDPTRTADGTPTTTTTDRRTPAADVQIASLQLQYGVVTPTSPDSIGISNPETPYLVASVRVDGALSREAFGLVMGDVRYAPTQRDRLYRTSWGGDHWYTRERREGLVLFEAPSTPTDHLHLRWPGGEHPVGDGIVTRLGGPAPRLSASLDVPTRHDRRTAPDLAITVTNDGETTSRFLGALNRVGPQVAYTPVARLSRLVPPDETVTVPVSDSWGGLPAEERIGDDDPDVTYHLAFVDGEDSARIRLVDTTDEAAES
jgi:hypothetical protein